MLRDPISPEILDLLEPAIHQRALLECRMAYTGDAETIIADSNRVFISNIPQDKMNAVLEQARLFIYAFGEVFADPFIEENKLQAISYSSLRIAALIKKHNPFDGAMWKAIANESNVNRVSSQSPFCIIGTELYV